MKRNTTIIIFGMAFIAFISFISCNEKKMDKAAATNIAKDTKDTLNKVDTTKIPDGPFGEAVKYGRQLLLNTAFYIGPNGINGKYLGNKMNCTNCHQDAGTKLYSFNLLTSHLNYPQYRARENKVLTLAERINNCVMRPHNGRPLPLDSKEMVAMLCYLKWINGFAAKTNSFKGAKNLEVSLPGVAASPDRGKDIYALNCARCHGANGEGILKIDSVTYIYPPLWGPKSYQPGSSMHRIIKLAQWLKSNMPFDKATAEKPFLTDEQALDVAAFVNNDEIHKRPGVKDLDYPDPATKAIDYAEPPFVDSFSTVQHKYGPFQPIINYWKAKGLKPVY